jgi:hypothetical protein
MSDQRPLSPREQDFFVDYLSTLSAEGIFWILLRNYEGFPKTIGHDLDLFIPRDDLDRATTIFLGLLSSAEGRVIIVHERDYFRDVRFVVEEAVSEVLTLDLYHGAFTWHGFHYLEDQALTIGACLTEEGLRVPRPAHEALGLVFASILWGGVFKIRYQPRIATLLDDPHEAEEFKACVFRAFGEGLDFDPACPEVPVKDALALYATRMRKALRGKQFQTAPLRAISQSFRYWLREWRSVLDPRGLAIAIVGPNGSAVSTAAAGIIEKVRGLFGEVHLHRLRPGILPNIDVLDRQDGVALDSDHAPRQRSASFVFSSLFRLIYYFVDCCLGYLPRVLKRKAQVHFVVFDQYASALWCDSAHYRFRLPINLIRLICAAVPSPDFTFVLLSNTASCAGGSADVTAEGGNVRYRQFAENCRNSILIDAAQPMERMVQQIESQIVRFLLQREADSSLK